MRGEGWTDVVKAVNQEVLMISKEEESGASGRMKNEKVVGSENSVEV